MSERYFSVREVAEMYNVTKAAVTLWIRQGKLRAVKLGAIWRVSEVDLKKFVAENIERVDNTRD